MIYNYTRCESVIAKIMADLDSSEVRQRVSDIKEWIFEAVDKIGAPMQYIRKESGTDECPILKIQDNQVPIPSDLIMLDGVLYSANINGPWTHMSVTTKIFREPKKTNSRFQEDVHLPMNQKLMTSQSQLYTVNNMKYVERLLSNNFGDRPEYFIKPGWLVTNKHAGYIKLSYKAIAVDERGYPLIPDLSSYQEAIYWYVVMKLSFPKFMSGTLSGGGSKYAAKYSQQAYLYVQQLWNFYRNQAYAEAMMPTADDMDNIKNDWAKLIPDWDARSTSFGDIGKELSIYTDYYYGY